MSKQKTSGNGRSGMHGLLKDPWEIGIEVEIKVEKEVERVCVCFGRRHLVGLCHPLT